MSKYYDKTLHHIGKRGEVPSIVVIGAMDGHSFDDMTGYFVMYEWSGLFVEPIPYQFEALVKFHDELNYAHNCKHENSAIAEFNGEIDMMTIDTKAIEDGVIHPCFGGMSAVWPPKNGLGSAGDAETVKRYGKMIRVPCKTLQTVLNEHSINHIDIIQVDAEGWDWKILKQLDFSLYRPKLIRSEYINLEPEEKEAMIAFFVDNGYQYQYYAQDIDFVDVHFWETISED